MTKAFIVEDSSFVVAVLFAGDKFHKDAVFVFRKLLEYREGIKIVLPSVCFFETIAILLRKGIAQGIIEDKLWKLLHHENLLFVSPYEMQAFKLTKRFDDHRTAFRSLTSSDLAIASIGLEFEAQILTFDADMRKRLGSSYPTIYFCSDKVRGLRDETQTFFTELDRRTGRDIPF